MVPVLGTPYSSDEKKREGDGDEAAREGGD
jgi:hypothetical protein